MQVKGRLDRETAAAYYHDMALIRVFERRCAEGYMRGKIRGFLHLYIGEEAIAVGVMSAIRADDYVVTHYRDHGHALARGLDPKAAMAELYGKATGCSRGKGGSMHLFDASRNFMGGHAIVGGQLPLATGLALACDYRETGGLVVCFFGDGALNQGEFHESLNLAALWGLPVLFFLENNLYGMGTHVDRTFAGGRNVYRASAHYSMPSRQIDGMDVMEVSQATSEVAAQVRNGGGPYLLEALTYRFAGHSMADPAEYRDKSEEEEWRQRDPLVTFRRLIVEDGAGSEEELQEADQRVEQEVEEAVRFAEESPWPGPESVYEGVYAR